MINILKAIFYIPLYNAFVLILHIPGIDAGLAVILFTIIIKIALFPLQKKALITQIRMKEINPEIKRLKEEIKDSQKQGQAMMKLYKDNKINPLLSFVLLLIQLPILISLYRIFQNGTLTHIDTSLLYFFITPVMSINPLFIGIVNVTQASILLAVLAAVTQFIQGQFQTMPMAASGNGSSFQDDLARSMSMQIKYILPVMIFFITFKLPAVIALYFITSNIFMVGQEFALRRHKKLLIKTQ